MANTLDKIRAAIAEHEEKLGELRAAEKVVAAIEPSAVVISPGLSVAINPSTQMAAMHQLNKTTPRQTVGALVMSVIAREPLNLGTILERVRATGKNVTDQSISSALQVLKKKGLVTRKGRMWKTK